jgi:hypothetical protein
VVSKAVNRFLYINTKICRRHGLEFEDLKTYAQIWTCNYLGLYKVANPTNNDNERKLYAHLCQRFGNFVEVLLKKERSCIPDPQTTSVALLGKPYEARSTARRAGQLYQDRSTRQPDGVSKASGRRGQRGRQRHEPEPLLDSNEVAEEEQEQKLTTPSVGRSPRLAQGGVREARSQHPHVTLLDGGGRQPGALPRRPLRGQEAAPAPHGRLRSCPKVQEQAAGRRCG